MGTLEYGISANVIHHSVAVSSSENRPEWPHVDLCSKIEVGGRKFLPLVRDALALRCGLKVLFLRKENPGRVYQGGDMDNRLKTLFDSLSIPNADQIVDDPDLEEPIYCLLEDDRLISGLSVETDRLLHIQTRRSIRSG